MLVEAPLDARKRLAQVHARGVIGIGGCRQRQLVLELNAIAPTVVQVDVGNLVVGLARIVVGDPAKVDFPVMVAGRTGIVGDEWGPSLRTDRDGADKRQNQQKDVEKTAHGRDEGSFRDVDARQWPKGPKPR